MGFMRNYLRNNVPDYLRHPFLMITGTAALILACTYFSIRYHHESTMRCLREFQTQALERIDESIARMDESLKTMRQINAQDSLENSVSN